MCPSATPESYKIIIYIPKANYVSSAEQRGNRLPPTPDFKMLIIAGNVLRNITCTGGYKVLFTGIIF